MVRLTRISRAPEGLQILLNVAGGGYLTPTPAGEDGPTWSVVVPDEVAAAVCEDRGLARHFRAEPVSDVAEEAPRRRRAERRAEEASE